jgi:hypothetical protein
MLYKDEHLSPIYKMVLPEILKPPFLFVVPPDLPLASSER